MLRLGGPFSKPLSWSGTFRQDYDLRECAVVDEIAGPGWGWPEPEHTCFWSDRADARLLIPLQHIGDHLIVLGLGEACSFSPNARVNVFANGKLLSTWDFTDRIPTSEYCVVVPRHVLFGPWVELSLRPRPYLGEGPGAPYWFTRSVPARGMRVFDMGRVREVFSFFHPPNLYLSILKGENPQAEKFDRIRRKIDSSPYRTDKGLPADFDPVVYVLAYRDLFEHEVDPYEHFLFHGRSEGRLWR
jgi:hypothetical protein